MSVQDTYNYLPQKRYSPLFCTEKKSFFIVRDSKKKQFSQGSGSSFIGRTNPV